MTPDVRVSVVIPAHNEAPSVGDVVTEVRRVLAADAVHGASFEVIVVDDGSTDDTSRVAQDAGAAVLRHAVSRGYGAALKRGMRQAEGRILVIIDADGTYPVSELPAMLRLMDEGAEQVIGARVAQGAKIPLLRRPAKWAVNWFARQLTRHPIPDLNSGFRCYDRRRLERYARLLPDGFSFSTTSTVAALLDGWEVRWHPIGYERRVGRSKFRAFHDTLRLLLSLVRAVMYCDPLRIFFPVALALGLVAAAFGAWDVLYASNLTDKTVLFTITSLEFFVLGLLADMIVKKL